MQPFLINKINNRDNWSNKGQLLGKLMRIKMSHPEGSWQPESKEERKERSEYDDGDDDDW